jgi:hypothetical protein
MTTRVNKGPDRIAHFERLGFESKRYNFLLDRLGEVAHADLCWRSPLKIYGGNHGEVKAGQYLQASTKIKIPINPGGLSFSISAAACGLLLFHH